MANIRRSRAGGFIRGGKSRRETFWVGIAETTTVLAVGTPVLFTGFGADTLALRPFTIIRTRGTLQLSTDQQAGSEVTCAAMGIAVVSDQALAVGVTAVPTPIAEKGSDLWFVFEAMCSRMLFGSDTGFNDGSGVTRDFDSRAMRKVEDGQDIALVKEASGASGFTGGRMTKVGRMLIKFH